MFFKNRLNVIHDPPPADQEDLQQRKFGQELDESKEKWYLGSYDQEASVWYEYQFPVLKDVQQNYDVKYEW